MFRMKIAILSETHNKAGNWHPPCPEFTAQM